MPQMSAIVFSILLALRECICVDIATLRPL